MSSGTTGLADIQYTVYFSANRDNTYELSCLTGGKVVFYFVLTVPWCNPQVPVSTHSPAEIL